MASLPGTVPNYVRPASSHSKGGSSTGSGALADDSGSGSPGRRQTSGYDSPNRSRQHIQSVASSQTPPTPPGNFRGEHKTAMDSQTIVSGHSTRTVEPNLLMGPRTSLNLRLKGEVHSTDVISKILNEENPKEVPVLHSYVLPHRQSYIPPKQMAPVDPRLEAFDNLQRGAAAGLIMGTEDDGPPSFTFSPSDRPHSGSSNMIPVAPIHRQVEVRELASFLMADLMRAVVASPDTRKQVSRATYTLYMLIPFSVFILDTYSPMPSVYLCFIFLP